MSHILPLLIALLYKAYRVHRWLSHGEAYVPHGQ